MSLTIGTRVVVAKTVEAEPAQAAVTKTKTDTSTRATTAEQRRAANTTPSAGAAAKAQMKALEASRKSEQDEQVKGLRAQLEQAAAFVAKNPELRPTQSEALEGLLRRASQVAPELLQRADVKKLVERFPDATKPFKGTLFANTSNPELARQADALGDRNGRVTAEEYGRLSMSLPAPNSGFVAPQLAQERLNAAADARSEQVTREARLGVK